MNIIYYRPVKLGFRMVNSFNLVIFPLFGPEANKYKIYFSHESALLRFHHIFKAKGNSIERLHPLFYLFK